MRQAHVALFAPSVDLKHEQALWNLFDLLVCILARDGPMHGVVVDDCARVRLQVALAVFVVDEGFAIAVARAPISARFQ